MFTNIGLVAHAKKALNENWGYCLGAFGNVLTENFLEQKCKQDGGVGSYNTSHKDYLKKFMSNRVSDCYGLVKSYLWWNGGNVKYNAVQDRNQEGAFNAAEEWGILSTIPETPGLVLWMKGHAGVYIGGGEFIECVGAPTGIRKGKIIDGQVTSGSRFTHWFRDTYITYEVGSSTVKLCIDGTNMEPEAVNIEGHWYITLPQLGGMRVGLRNLLESAGYIVTWDEASKTIAAIKSN